MEEILHISHYLQCFGFIYIQTVVVWDFFQATSLPEIYQLTWPDVAFFEPVIVSLHFSASPLEREKFVSRRIGQKNRQKTGWNWFCCMQARKNPAGCLDNLWSDGIFSGWKKDGAIKEVAFFFCCGKAG